MKLLRSLLALALVGFVSVNALSQERGTKDEAKAMAEQAVAHVKKVGPDQAFKDFSTDKATWTKKDLYVFANDINGNTKAHGANDKLVGKNMAELKDQNGKLFIKEMSELAKSKGSGWVEYDWAHPQTKKVDGKATYVIKLSNFDGYVGVGVYR
ncbi:MAG: cache domain-containing protein [Rhodoferax sp.]|nr:cache domain-containing protein [Rhodoferax sp.]